MSVPGPGPGALCDAAVEIAREAGELLLSRFRRSARAGLAVRGERDPVTDADRDADALIRRRIRERFPDHEIESEESSAVSAGGAGGGAPCDAAPRDPESSCCWIVDPLDGTVNFLHGHPMYAVSIGVLEGGRPVAGVVHAPSLRETFAGAAGAGATLNGAPLRVTATERLLDALLATGFPYARSRLRQNNLANFGRLALAARGVRRNGAASLDLAYVAAGIYDGFWELWLRPWDVAAGALLVREAGGRVTDVPGGDEWLRGGTIVASNGSPLHEEIRGRLDPFDPAERPV
ncbi:MAG: inositol monophosphatase [Planctomycetales bacterium]|nr:inositol monophosphatase [Planctomycetales bacterium]